MTEFGTRRVARIESTQHTDLPFDVARIEANNKTNIYVAMPHSHRDMDRFLGSGVSVEKHADGIYELRFGERENSSTDAALAYVALHRLRVFDRLAVVIATRGSEARMANLGLEVVAYTRHKEPIFQGELDAVTGVAAIALRRGNFQSIDIE